MHAQLISGDKPKTSDDIYLYPSRFQEVSTKDNQPLYKLLVIWHWKRSDLGLSLNTGKSAWRGENRRCINAFPSSFWADEAQAQFSVRERFQRFEEYFFSSRDAEDYFWQALMSRNARMAKMRSISSGFWINSWFCLLYNVSWLTETEMLGRVLGLILLRDPRIIWWIIITRPNATLTFCRGNGSVPFFKKRSECDSSAKVLVGEVQVALVHAIIYIPYPWISAVKRE